MSKPEYEGHHKVGYSDSSPNVDGHEHTFVTRSGLGSANPAFNYTGSGAHEHEGYVPDDEFQTLLGQAYFPNMQGHEQHTEGHTHYHEVWVPDWLNE